MCDDTCVELCFLTTVFNANIFQHHLEKIEKKKNVTDKKRRKSSEPDKVDYMK